MKKSLEMVGCGGLQTSTVLFEGSFIHGNIVQTDRVEFLPYPRFGQSDDEYREEEEEGVASGEADEQRGEGVPKIGGEQHADGEEGTDKSQQRDHVQQDAVHDVLEGTVHLERVEVKD